MRCRSRDSPEIFTFSPFPLTLVRHAYFHHQASFSRTFSHPPSTARTLSCFSMAHCLVSLIFSCAACSFCCLLGLLGVFVPFFLCFTDRTLYISLSKRARMHCHAKNSHRQPKKLFLYLQVRVDVVLVRVLVVFVHGARFGHIYAIRLV